MYDMLHLPYLIVILKLQGTLFFSAQVDDTEVISFLLSTEIIPLCLRTMEMGSELSKTVGPSSKPVSSYVLPRLILDFQASNFVHAGRLQLSLCKKFF